MPLEPIPVLSLTGMYNEEFGVSGAQGLSQFLVYTETFHNHLD